MRAVFIFLLILFWIPSNDMQAHQYAGKGNAGVFRHVYAVGYKGNYVVTGEAKSKAGSFYYSVEDGHAEFIHDKKVKVKGKRLKWKPFKISINIPDTALPDNGSVVLNLYERNSEGESIHSYPVILERFY